MVKKKSVAKKGEEVSNSVSKKKRGRKPEAVSKVPQKKKSFPASKKPKRSNRSRAKSAGSKIGRTSKEGTHSSSTEKTDSKENASPNIFGGLVSPNDDETAISGTNTTNRNNNNNPNKTKTIPLEFKPSDECNKLKKLTPSIEKAEISPCLRKCSSQDKKISFERAELSPVGKKANAPQKKVSNEKAEISPVAKKGKGLEKKASIEKAGYLKNMSDEKSAKSPTPQRKQKRSSKESAFEKLDPPGKETGRKKQPTILKKFAKNNKAGLLYFRNMAESRKAIKFKEIPEKSGVDVMPEKLKGIKKKTGKRNEIGKTTEELDDVSLKIRNNENGGKLFNENGLPFWWTDEVLSEKEAEENDLDMEGRITSAHVVKFLEGTLTPAPPPPPPTPNFHLQFDVFGDVELMKERDDKFFSDEAIMYSTLQNIVKHCKRAVDLALNEDEGEVRRRPTSSNTALNIAQLPKDLSERKSSIVFDMQRNESIVYDRRNPVLSIKKYWDKKRKIIELKEVEKE